MKILGWEALSQGTFRPLGSGAVHRELCAAVTVDGGQRNSLEAGVSKTGPVVLHRTVVRSNCWQAQSEQPLSQELLALDPPLSLTDVIKCIKELPVLGLRLSDVMFLRTMGERLAGAPPGQQSGSKPNTEPFLGGNHQHVACVSLLLQTALNPPHTWLG